MEVKSQRYTPPPVSNPLPRMVIKQKWGTFPKKLDDSKSCKGVSIS